MSELEELSEQYEDIMEDCGHGRFQWTLFMVLGLALMADGVECFVVAFVLPSAEKDLCLSNAEKGMLGKVFTDALMLTVSCFFKGVLMARRVCSLIVSLWSVINRSDASGLNTVANTYLCVYLLFLLLF